MLKIRFCNRVVSAIVLANALLVAGTTAGNNDPSSDMPEANTVSLNFPENLELKVLVDYVSRRLGINILYDEQIDNRRVTISAPSKIPVDSLLGLLESTLKMKGLALVEGEQPGWKRVVPVANLVSISDDPKETGGAEAVERQGTDHVVTRVFQLQHTDPNRTDQLIKLFLTQPGGNSVGITEHNLLIVTDYQSSMNRISRLIQLADQPLEGITIEFVPVQYQQAEKLSQQALKIIRSKLQAQSQTRGGGGEAVSGLDVTFDERSNQVIVVGTRDRVTDAVQIVKSLDVSLGLETKMYQFKIVSPERIDRLAKELIGPVDTGRLYRSAVDKELGFLVVTATPEVHQKVESLKRDLDVPAAESQSPIRFYKLENAAATDVLEILSALEGGSVTSSEQKSSQSENRSDMRFSGLNQPPGAAGLQPLSPQFYPQSNALDNPLGNQVGNPFGDEQAGLQNSAPQPANITVRSDRAIMTADTNTNSIIIAAKPEVHSIYEKLIRKLDQRRPQVLIEMTIVVLDTSDNFSLGVEISHHDTDGDPKRMTFSSFGLSVVNAVTGALAIKPGLGFNGAVISSDVADIVIQALKNDRRSRVVSAPRILVNDNAKGILSSIDEQPVQSINASDTVSTTSFGGFVEAGTSITVTPHISEGDYLTLEYAVALNSFTGPPTLTDEGGSIPAPRKTNAIESHVTVPDGHTVVVGGLNRSDYSNNVDAVPILGEIPILRHLFGNEKDEKSDSTLFVFIRPVILRDDQFADLKYLSQKQMSVAQLPNDYPNSEPLVIE